MARHGFTHVEISDGVVDMPRERKLELIGDLARDFTVLSEVGSKDADEIFAPYQWVEWITEELAAGSWKVITEGREGGTAGIYRPRWRNADGPRRRDRAWRPARRPHLRSPAEVRPGVVRAAIRPEVNLGNIPPDEVIALETLRRGLRADTLKEVLLGDQQPV